jgi:PAS domain S-box-containing protein
MKSRDRTKPQHINKQAAMHQRVAELEKLKFEHRLAEMAMREACTYAEAIIETVREPLIVLNNHLKVLSVNCSFCDTFHVTPDATVGNFFFDLGNGQWDIPTLRKLLEDILPANNKFDGYEVDHIFPAIGHKIMLLSARRIYRKGEGTQRILLAIEDITDRKRAEEELRASETRYRRLFETAQDGILILNADTGQINDVNPFLIDMLGYTRRELLGKKLWEIGAFEDNRASKAAFEELQRNGYIRYEDLPLKTKDGREISVEFISNIYLVNHSQVIQCNIRDITDRKKADEERERLILELRDALNKVRTLHGMLPICASCKKIRNDKGYWEQIESYLEDHSEAEFTHGICPDCARALYPKLHKNRGASPGKSH